MWRRLIATAVVATLASPALAVPARAGGFNEPFYGDVTGDGRADRVTLGYRQPNECVVIVEPGRPGGWGVREVHAYRSPADQSGENWCPHMGVVIDLGWDGSNEIAVAWFDGPPPGIDHPILVLRDFQPSASYMGLRYPNYLKLADFDGDGHDDIYQVSDQGGGFTTYINTATGTLVPGPMQWCSALSQYVLADFDADGAMDAVLAFRHECDNDDTGVVVIRDDGTPIRLQQDRTGDTSWRVAIIDANGDGFPDVQTTDLRSGDVDVFINDGGGTFTLAPVANHDTAVVRNNNPTGISVLDNDITSSDVRITVVTPPRYGTAQVTSGGQIVYRPTTGDRPRDYFVYQLTENGRSDFASVSIRHAG